jgi:signal transduction histidine kinase
VQKISLRILIYTFLNILLIILALIHLPRIFERPKAPLEVSQDGDNIYVDQVLDTTAAGELRVGDRLISWNNQNIPILQAVDFLTSFGKIGENIEILYERNHQQIITKITLIEYYPSYRYLFIILFVGFVIWMFSFFVLYYGPDNSASRTLHWCFTALSVALLTTTGLVERDDIWVYVTEIVLFMFYMFTVSGFFFFSTIFPLGEKDQMTLRKIIIFIPSNILVGFILYYRLSSIYYLSLDDFVSYQSIFALFHITLFIFIGGAIFNFIYAYRHTRLSEERKQIKWVLWGLITGSLPFLVLYILPQILANFLPDIFTTQEPIREEYTHLFFLIIPFAFTVAIIKYHFVDINFLISRTIGYSILTLFLGAVYITAVMVVISTFEQAIFDEYLLPVGIALFLFLIFNPLRTRIQKFIDELFFPGRQLFRNAVKDISEKLLQSLRSDDLFSQLITGLCKYIPVSNMAIYVKSGMQLRLRNQFKTGARETINLPGDLQKMSSNSTRIFAKEGAIKTHLQNTDFSQETFLNDIGFAIGLPLTGKNNEFHAILFVTPYHQTSFFIEEEVDLLITGVSVASEMLDRLILQEKIILEQADKQRIKEISDLKSYFVSNVSHELKSPLSSIKAFAELLAMNKNLPTKERIEFAHIIDGETDRLTRLIDNVLDISKIEQGAKYYQFKPANPVEIIDDVLKSLRYQLEQYQFDVHLNFEKDIGEIEADSEALKQALANLVTNVIKYSGDTKYLEIKLHRQNQYLAFDICDKGIGISKRDIKHIFDNFYRSQDDTVRTIGGTGIGLTVVNHIINAHNGKIEVESELGKGTRFTLLIPSTQ